MSNPFVNLKVVGVTSEGRQEILASLASEGEEHSARLWAEPYNKYDPKAVAVMAMRPDESAPTGWRPIQVGYLERDWWTVLREDTQDRVWHDIAASNPVKLKLLTANKTIEARVEVELR